jgi:nucleoside-diphosphate-sugar epimerase
MIWQREGNDHRQATPSPFCNAGMRLAQTILTCDDLRHRQHVRIMAKILLVGGSGFLSGTMARCALREGHEVWTVTRGKRPSIAGVQPIVGDRKDRPAFAGVFATLRQTWDLVIDCIGFDAGDAKQDIEVFANRARHLVFISTDFVLSPDNRPWKVDETYERWNDTPYGSGKRAAEEVLLEYSRRADASAMRATILRPCHIYGPGALLGCLPKHGRDPELIDRLKRGEAIQLIGGGFFLQQPVFAEDLWAMAISCMGNARSHGEIYFSPGAEIVESRVFYSIVADILGAKLAIEEIPISVYLKEHPEHRSFCAHRVYSTDKAHAHGLRIPATSLTEGLRRHVESIVRG